MSRRSYDQLCGLALGLDVAGERWTALIVRELMSGPKRYVDIADSLDGIGSSLLAARLRQMEDDGLLVKRRLPKPAASVVYELTEAGDELGRAMAPLAMWGLKHLAAATAADKAFRAEWALVFLARLMDGPTSAAGRRHTYEFRIGDTAAVLVLDGEDVRVTGTDVVTRPDVVVTLGVPALIEIGSGRVPISEALADGSVTLDGDSDAAAALIDILPERLSVHTSFAGDI